MSSQLDRVQLRRLWELALSEDGVESDVTSELTVEESFSGRAYLRAREAGVFAGDAIFGLLKEAYSNRLTVTGHLSDSDRLEAGDIVATLEGPLRLLLGIERTLLNFLQRLCGVATLTRRFVDAAAGTSAQIYDTRKTVPGWRQLDKYGVRCGGGRNHRMGLHDGILIKDNHLVGVSRERLAARVFEILSDAPPASFVEVEVDTLDQYDELLKVVGVDLILLDNFTLDEMREAVRRREKLGLVGRIQLEVSGGAQLEEVPQIAAAGIDRIAVGALTHSAPALDIGMDIEPMGEEI